MKTAFLLLGAAALVAACPDDWVNPCIITSKELAPKNERWCGTSRSGYIGQVGNSGTGSNNYVNDWGAALGFYDSSLNIQSYNGVRASGSNPAAHSSASPASNLSPSTASLWSQGAITR